MKVTEHAQHDVVLSISIALIRILHLLPVKRSVTSYPDTLDTQRTNVLETRSEAQSIPRTWLPTQPRRKSLRISLSRTHKAVAVAEGDRIADVLS